MPFTNLSTTVVHLLIPMKDLWVSFSRETRIGNLGAGFSRRTRRPTVRSDARELAFLGLLALEKR